MTISASTVLTNNRTQAVRLSAEARLTEGVKKVNVRVRGQERIITPVENTWDHFFKDGLHVSDEFMSERAEQKGVVRESF